MRAVTAWMTLAWIRCEDDGGGARSAGLTRGSTGRVACIGAVGRLAGACHRPRWHGGRRWPCHPARPTALVTLRVDTHAETHVAVVAVVAAVAVALDHPGRLLGSRTT